MPEHGRCCSSGAPCSHEYVTRAWAGSLLVHSYCGQPSPCGARLGPLLCSVQTSMYGQTPETALSAALAAINFAMQQQDLSFQFQADRMQKKMTKLHEQCKRKLQELHNGYQAVSSVLQPVLSSLCLLGHMSCTL